MAMMARRPRPAATGRGGDGGARILAQPKPKQDVDFALINRAALPVLPTLLARWLPGGQRVGAEWVARNPTREDRNLGSFRINLRTGRWADFATGDKGGDVVSLSAYLFGLSQVEAARRIAIMLEVA
jgi:hypothetical protein